VLGLGVGGPLGDMCEVEDKVVGDAHGHPHGWSGKKILTSATLSGDVVAPSCRKMR
jgi:hypothetical protein